MVIGIMGESCAGKSSLAERIEQQIGAEIISGNDYMRLAKSESMARVVFKKKLQGAMSEGNIIYVISEKDQLSFLPENALRILVTAQIETIKKRFAKRMNGNLPDPVAEMLERKHGLFDNEKYDLRIENEDGDLDKASIQIMSLLNDK